MSTMPAPVPCLLRHRVRVKPRRVDTQTWMYYLLCNCPAYFHQIWVVSETWQLDDSYLRKSCSLSSPCMSFLNVHTFACLGFEGRMWHLIVLIVGHCLSFTLELHVGRVLSSSLVANAQHFRIANWHPFYELPLQFLWRLNFDVAFSLYNINTDTNSFLFCLNKSEKVQKRILCEIPVYTVFIPSFVV